MEKKGRYSPGFEAAWAAYPHFEGRSKKKLAAAVWERDRLEIHTARVLGWIGWYGRTVDWTKHGGMFVPGMQVWLNQQEFGGMDPPPTVEPTPQGPFDSSADTQPVLGGLAALDEAKRAELRRASDERIRAALLARDERERRLGRP